MPAPLPDETAALFDTLSDPDRLSVYLRLMACCRGAAIRMTPDQALAWVADAAAGTGLGLKTVTDHLAILKKAGLVHVSVDADTVDCRFDSHRFKTMADIFHAADRRPATTTPATQPEKENAMRTPISADAIRANVRNVYGDIARTSTAKASAAACGCGCGAGTSLIQDANAYARAVGYTAEDTAIGVDGANLGLGCGNPGAIAALRPGEAVLDLGSGGGFDCFLAARAVGPAGSVIGVDMTPDMITRARKNAASAGAPTVSFRLGEIEHLPVADATIDVIISNCVVNLSPDKSAVFKDAFRVLKPGGRLAMSDMVALSELPEAISGDMDQVAACIGGAATVDELTGALAVAGFEDVRIAPREAESRRVLSQMPGYEKLAGLVASATVEAVKPISAAGEQKGGRQ
ncbi:MAG: arsenite methyltransferase [Pseudomonadota bacterium]